MAATAATPRLSGSLALASAGPNDANSGNPPVPPPLALDTHLLCALSSPTASAAAVAAAKRTRGLMRAQMGFLDQEHRLPSTLTVRFLLGWGWLFLVPSRRD